MKHPFKVGDYVICKEPVGRLVRDKRYQIQELIPLTPLQAPLIRIDDLEPGKGYLPKRFVLDEFYTRVKDAEL